MVLVVYSTCDFQELYITFFFFQEKNRMIVFFLIFHVKSKSTSAEYVAKEGYFECKLKQN